MPEQYTDEWWHIQAPPLVFPSDDFAEAMTKQSSEYTGSSLTTLADLPWKEPMTPIP